MSPIRHDGIILIGVVVLGVISGFAPAAWTGAALLVSIGVNRSTRIIAGAGRDNAGEGLVRMLFLVSAVSIILAIVFAILLLINFGWIIGASFAVLFFAYFAVKEDSNAKAKREVARTRALLQDYVAQREAASLRRTC